MSGLRHRERRHPDATAIAEYRAGLAGGRRGRRLAAHVAGCARCASVSDQLAAVSSALSSAPAPPLPDSVERRITAALATATAPAREAAPATETTPARSRHRVWRLRPVLAVSATAACLVLAGVVYLVGFTGSPAGPVSSSAAGSSASSPLAGVAAPAAGSAPANSAAKAAFLVTASGTRYEPATLAAQVRAQLAAHGSTPAPASSRALQGAQRPSSAAAGAVPSAALTGCVLHLTKQVAPTLVDRATYQGQPAYVIAVPDRVWVVGPDCTASNPDLITSIGL